MTTSNLSKIRPKLRTEGRVSRTMTTDFVTSNLSKIKTKLRTSGAISQPRRKAGSPINDIGVTKTEVVKCTKPDDYLARLYQAFENTTDPKLKSFLYKEIRKILIQKGMW